MVEVCKGSIQNDEKLGIRITHGKTYIQTINCTVTILRKELIKLMAVVMFSSQGMG